MTSSSSASVPAQAFMPSQATPPPPPPPQVAPTRMPLTLVSSRGSSAPPPLARHYTAPAYGNQPAQSASGSRLVYAPPKARFVETKASKNDEGRAKSVEADMSDHAAPVMVAPHLALPKRFFASKGPQRPMLSATGSLPLRAMSPHAHPPPPPFANVGKMYAPQHLNGHHGHGQFSPSQSNNNQSSRGYFHYNRKAAKCTNRRINVGILNI